MTVPTTPALETVKAMLLDALRHASLGGDEVDIEDEVIIVSSDLGEGMAFVHFDADKLANRLIAWSDARHAAEIDALKWDLAETERHVRSWEDWDQRLKAEHPEIFGEPSAPSPSTPVCKKMIAGEDGWSEWVNPVQGYLMQCCDCGLIHEMQTEVVRQIAPTDANGQADVESVDDPALLVSFRMRRHAPPEAATVAEPSSIFEAVADSHPETVTIPLGSSLEFIRETLKPLFDRADALPSRGPVSSEAYDARLKELADMYGVTLEQAAKLEAPPPQPFKLSAAHRALSEKVRKLSVHTLPNSKNEFVKRFLQRQRGPKNGEG